MPEEQERCCSFLCFSCGPMMSIGRYKWDIWMVDLSGERLAEFERRYRWFVVRNGREDVLNRPFWEVLSKSVRAYAMDTIESAASKSKLRL